MRLLGSKALIHKCCLKMSLNSVFLVLMEGVAYGDDTLNANPQDVSGNLFFWGGHDVMVWGKITTYSKIPLVVTMGH